MKPNHENAMARRIAGIAATTAIGIATIGVGTAPALADEPSTQPTDGETQTTPADETFTAAVGNSTVTLDKDDDGNYTGTLDGYDGIPADTITVSSATHPNITLTGTGEQHLESPAIGVVTATGVKTYTGTVPTEDEEDMAPTITVTVNYTSTMGEEVTLDDGTKLEDDTTVTMSLGNDDKPAADTLGLSNGQKLDIQWDDATGTTVVDGHTQVTLHGIAQGVVDYTDTPGIDYSWPVEINVEASRTDTWTAAINGTQTPFQTNEDGSQSITADKTGKYPTAINVTGSNGKTATLDPTVTGLTATGSQTLGVMNVAGTGKYHADKTGDLPQFDITMPFAYTTGDEIAIQTSDGSDNIQFTQDEGGVFTATAPTITLDTANKPASDAITLTDGSKAEITWDKAPSVVERDGANFIVLTGTATGTVTVTDPASRATVTQQYRITVNASRAEDKTFTDLAVQQTTPDGTITATTVDGFDPATHEYSLTLPHDSISNAFTLTTTTGVDATVGAPTVGFGANGGRVLAITVNDVAYTVNVSFTPSDIQPDSPAKLEGIYVSSDGTIQQGTLIDNWDPNRLDYVVSLGENDPSPYILPVAPDGVTISAGDVTQNAQSSTQVWTVTDTASGVSRQYSVTVTRPVETAVTKFTPNTPIAQEPTVQPDSPTDAQLASHGYVDSNGVYVPVDEDDYQIPEGGTFSYEAKAGQTVSVSASSVGMTYTYTVTVLPQDTSGFPQSHTFTVTYITEATHRAELTGIAVDGTLIGGFDPATREYTVAVNDTDEWTVTPQYDKDTGMSVSTSKDGTQAVITVTSGDGLNSVQYTVNVTQKLFGGDGTSGFGGLAQTGVSIGGVLAAIAATLAAGAAAAMARRGTRKNNN